MKTLIVGPGAMGCLFALLMARRGADVALLDYRPDRAERLNQKGISMEGVSGEFKAHVPVSCRSLHFDPDLVIMCVKAYKTREAAAELKGLIRRSCIVLTLQNGLGNLEILKGFLGKEACIAGITSEGATLLQEGHVRHAGKGETVIGAGDLTEERVLEIVHLFNSCGMNTRWERDATPLIWGKLMVNVGINALTGLLWIKNGVLRDIDPARDLINHLLREAVEVAKAKGIGLPYPDPVKKVLEVCEHTSGNISSMLQDIMKGRETEVDFINGAIVREAEALGLDAPYNRAMTLLIKALEASRSQRLQEGG